MTDEMLDLARANAREAGVTNVEFIKGYLEDMPLPDASVDVVISNCVINLSGDKPKTIAKAARVLRPGGRFAISDVIADPDIDEQTKADMAAWTGCIAGTLTEAEFRQTLAAAGFDEIEIRPTHKVHEHASSAIIRARKPAASGCCSTDTQTTCCEPDAKADCCGEDHAAGTCGCQSGTVNDELQLNDPQTLYRRWEDSQWSPFAINLETDRAQWPALGAEQRELLLFALSSLMVAEERITTKFSGLVGAHGTEEETTFLATQQVDEARHMQFYARFQDEVIATPQVIGAHVQRAREHVSDSFRQLFDIALVNAHAQLVAAPADLAAKVSFVTLYHLVLESALGLTTFKFITDYLSANQLLPGFVDGYSKIHHDETRHIGYGIWYLRDTIREHPDQRRHRPPDAARPPAISRRITQTTRHGTTESVLDISQDDLRQFALDGLTRRPNIIGVPITTL